MIKYISGPVKISRMKSNIYKRDIYFVEDKHFSLTGECKMNKQSQEFYLFIDKIFKDNPNKLYDYFIEEAFEKKNKNVKTVSYLSKTAAYFKDKGCLSIESNNIKKCRKVYPNVRFHITDVRDNVNNYKVDNEIYILKIFQMGLNSIYAPKELTIQNIDKVKDFLLNIKYKKNLLKYYKEMWNTKIIKIQYKKIKDKYIKQRIKKYFDNYFNEIINHDDIKKFLKHINKKMSGKETYSIFSSKIFFALSFDIGAMYMDLYLLLRLFKDFNNNPTKNIIIHAGSAHIFFYMSFLKSIGFKITETTKNKSERCLDISKMNEFFN